MQRCDGLMVSALDSRLKSLHCRFQARLCPGSLCPWARHFTLTVPHSTVVYKRILANLMLGGNPVIDKHHIQGGVEIFLVSQW